MTKTKKAADLDKPVVPPSEADFKGQQLDLFRSFLCNSEDERARLSNTFDLWDSVPRYAVSRQQMDKIRKAKGFLDLQQVEFQYRGTTLKTIIQAARVLDEKTGMSKDYYPSATEELIEDALRKIAADQQNAFFDRPNFRSGVVFTLYMLREELKKRGHTRSYQEIILSLQILARSTIEIRTTDGKGGEAFAVSSYFSGLSAVTKGRLAEDPHAKWIVQFHPLVTQEIDALTYRQFNYAQMMSHRTQLARWLHKQLSLKFTFASLITPFEMRYRTVRRDSALLDSYGRERKAIEALDAALDELVTARVLGKFEKKSLLGLRGKVEDVVYTLFASSEFSHDMKAANKRKQIAEERQTETGKLSTAPKNR
ncbi:replication protein [Methylococcus sp. EFPC2]|uniref:replication protein n=1 Tax=Methylococcus sp. EFPC2 TaxID=2812648 RepID=UPI00196764A0|nr:replication protein [Methylococcus sp. EFPC2]QSA99328.1 replication protein [Methylococcus sp. EFPC2]